MTNDAGAGPSPLARGRQTKARTTPQLDGAIPARAGPPCGVSCVWSCVRGHPRSRGAAKRKHRDNYAAVGPSPLARGRPAALAASDNARGAIPARAGPPSSSSHAMHRLRGHPRSRGAAQVRFRSPKRERGPSPLARGRLINARQHRQRMGAIPARAGPPCPQGFQLLHEWGHPRSRGAASKAQVIINVQVFKEPLPRNSGFPGRLEAPRPKRLAGRVAYPDFSQPIHRRLARQERSA
jgi:hypothetical protein